MSHQPYITLASARDYIADDLGAENLIKGENEITDPQLFSAFKAATRTFNDLQPRVVTFSYARLPDEHGFMYDLIAAEAYRRLIRVYDQMAIDHTSGGVITNPIKTRIDALKKEADRLETKGTKLAQDYKVSENIKGGFGLIG